MITCAQRSHDHVIYGCPYRVICGSESLIHARTHAHFPCTLRDAIAFKIWMLQPGLLIASLPALVEPQGLWPRNYRVGPCARALFAPPSQYSRDRGRCLIRIA